MAKLDNTVSTKVADSTLKRIEEYADAHGMNRSAAVRDCIRTGLETGRVPGVHVSYGAVAFLLGLIFVSAQYAEASGAVGPIGTAAVVAGILYELGYRLGVLGGNR